MKNTQWIHIALAALCTALLLASSCKPDPPKPKDPVTIYNNLGEVKDYCVFKPGTWWVYQNDLTGDIDSHWVASCQVWKSTEHGTESWSKHVTLVQELFDMVVKTNFTDGLGNKCYWEYYTTGEYIDVYPGPPSQGFVVTGRKVWKSGGTYNDIFVKPYFTTSNYTPYQLAFYPKYTVSGVEYDSVRVFRVENDGVFPESKTPTVPGGRSDYYFAKGFGIIKIYNQGYRALDDAVWNQTWSLIRKKIVQ
ncbi:MAG: hypothetical protein JNL57_03425 [Bacteroidetes bacterium]|nr:hypothetical protein [Bacteroidota bacterium]